jgi:hypothetical protein
MVSFDRPVPNPFSVGGREIPVLAVRRMGLVATALSILALLFVAALWLRRRPRDEASRIEARFASLLIPVQDVPALRQEAIEVTDIETLVRLAQQFEQPIMYQSQGAGCHSYWLYYDGLLYGYRISGAADDVPVLHFEPKPTAQRPLVRAVLTRPIRPDVSPVPERYPEIQSDVSS